MPATIDAGCYGCIVVIMNCPHWAWHCLTALKHRILAQFGSDLRSITQIDCNDVAELSQRQDNIQFRPLLQQLQAKMSLNQVPNIIKHKLSTVFSAPEPMVKDKLPSETIQPSGQELKSEINVISQDLEQVGTDPTQVPARGRQIDIISTKETKQPKERVKPKRQINDQPIVPNIMSLISICLTVIVSLAIIIVLVLLLSHSVAQYNAIYFTPHASSSTQSSIALASRSRLAFWSQLLFNTKDILLGQMGMHSLSKQVNRNTSNPLNEIKLNFSNPTSLGMPADWILDPECSIPGKWFYRTIDGSCNWPREGETSYGRTGTPFSRDVMKSFYDDGISTPRKGPNERELSNRFFAKTTESTEYEHTPILVGLIEFIIHDIAFSMPSREMMEVPIPKCDTAFDPECHGNKTMKTWRSASMEGTGTDPSNPRETKNNATSWLDLSALYGSNPETAKKLRTFKNGKLLTQQGPDGKEYPPFNTFGIPIFGHRPGIDSNKLFAFGDPRGNQNWLIIAVETLLLREHNRLCNILQSQFPLWDDETVYQFARHSLSVKYQMIINVYQQAYFTEEMPRSHIDGIPLFRQWHAKNMLQMSTLTQFPFWPGLVNGKPVTTSQEMAIGYRFHEILPTNVPLVNETGQINGTYNIIKTAFDSEGFLKAGLENVLRGMAAVQIPNFHTGTSDEYRNMIFNLGDPSENVFYDLVADTITHERERGLPAFNDYFRAYTGKPQVHIRNTFEEFTTNPVYLKALKEFYNHPDEVDLTVGQYLDEEYFPGTTVPRSQLITSLFSLFSLGVSDRFSPGYISVKCLPFFGTQTPFTCTPTNALEYLLWKPTALLGFEVYWYDAFWLHELSIDDYGTSALWRLVTDNSDIKCLQKNPLFPVDPITNPVVCSYEEFYPGTWLVPSIKFGFFAFVIITSILCVRPLRPQE